MDVDPFSSPRSHVLFCILLALLVFINSRLEVVKVVAVVEVVVVVLVVVVVVVAVVVVVVVVVVAAVAVVVVVVVEMSAVLWDKQQEIG
ncbi:hypothetical protein ElyMa_001517300 [Elysia marginata]|uniref:ABC transmembrane type-1 domain-containing protein n=1 Tax=Elysia marginata TaxID=1093978 RepID=A0AAV4J790_9GAST|nr:hypothetical protein ElyMa_001517300 [Elysia marginata]